MGAPIKIIAKGRLTKTKQFLSEAAEMDFRRIIEAYGKRGCELLKDATPKRTGKTSESWKYDVRYDKDGSVILSYLNTNMIGHTPIVKLIINGHLTSRGYWVEPNDFVTPTIQPIFSALAKDIWKEVRNHGH